MIISPCISICKTDPSTGFCYGCGRSNKEKQIWKKDNTSDDWKKNNLERKKKDYLAGSLRVSMSLMNTR